MSQTSMVDDPTRAYPGLVADSAQVRDIISRILNVLEFVVVQVTGNTDGTYQILADGVVQASFTASTNTVEEIRDGLLTDWDTTHDVEAQAVASGTDLFLIQQTNRFSTTDLNITVTGPGSPDITATQELSQAEKVPFGIGVVTDTESQGTDVADSGTQCRLPHDTGEVTGNFLGISMGDTSYPNDDGTGYASQTSIPIVHRGRVWVRTEDACDEKGDVYCRVADPTAAYGLGSFRSDADGSDAEQVPNAKYMLASEAGGLNIVELL